MIKDTFFSMPRFVNLCRKDMVESWRTNLLRVLLLYGVMTVVILWMGYFEYRETSIGMDKEDPMWNFTFVFLLWSLLGFGCLSASFTMEKMKSKTGRLSMLMIPATSFEKYFSRWLLSTVIFFAVFLIAFLLADYTRVLIYSLAYPELEKISAFPLFGGEESDSTIKVIVAFIIFAQSCFVLGSTIWPKNAFLKTFVAGAIIAIVYSLLAAWMGDLFYDEKTRSIARDLGRDTKFAYGSIILYAFTLFNWVFGYFRFKESEIINRM